MLSELGAYRGWPHSCIGAGGIPTPFFLLLPRGMNRLTPSIRRVSLALPSQGGKKNSIESLAKEEMSKDG